MTKPMLATHTGALFAICAGWLTLLSATPALAQTQDQGQALGDDYLGALKTCRAISDEAERLACYDAKVGAMVTASDAGDMRIVDRDDIRRTRRQLFGFTLPDLDLLKGDTTDTQTGDLFETTITGARRLSAKEWRFTTEEGAVWEITSAPQRLAPIKAGDTVVFKGASFGFYFIRINGQMGVKGKRIQ